ncbi:hypothetical protein HDU67_009538 [Dinochytrium kinnereticum]|nr:hypothetical protein HDU67_009538 [Dinochytrium kinnereticum]
MVLPYLALDPREDPKRPPGKVSWGPSVDVHLDRWSPLFKNAMEALRPELIESPLHFAPYTFRYLDATVIHSLRLDDDNASFDGCFGPRVVLKEGLDVLGEEERMERHRARVAAAGGGGGGGEGMVGSAMSSGFPSASLASPAATGKPGIAGGTFGGAGGSGSGSGGGMMKKRLSSGAVGSVVTSGGGGSGWKEMKVVAEVKGGVMVSVRTGPVMVTRE